MHLALSLNSSHGAALNNLAVLQWRKHDMGRAESLLNSAIAAEDHLYEPHYNRALLAQEVNIKLINFLNLKNKILKSQFSFKININFSKVKL